MGAEPIVIMGVSGVGKSTVGAELSRRLARPFVDADDLHPFENRRKMSSGEALEDADRYPWLHIVGEVVANRLGDEHPPVIACSALKSAYRNILRDYASSLLFVHLDGDAELISSRLALRSHEYMPSSLLGSQLETLEPPAAEPNVLRLDVRASVDHLVDEAARWIQQREYDPTTLTTN